MKYYLFLDDERDPKKVTWVNLPQVEWVIARNYDQFVNIIQTNGLPVIISFDHDLADEHYKEYAAAHDPKSPTQGRINYNLFKEKTGYECARFLVNYCLENDLNFPIYFIHTMNPIGGTNIFSLIESYKRSRQ